jgi:copper chaperone
MKTITFKVQGMSCKGCVASVTRILTSIAGVDRAVVLLEPASAEVTFDPMRASVGALKLAAAEAGYGLVD